MRNPHVWNRAADICLNAPVGGEPWPWSLSPMNPQQVMVPSVRNPHEWVEPDVTAVNEPSGAFVCPSRVQASGAFVCPSRVQAFAGDTGWRRMRTVSPSGVEVMTVIW